METKTLNVSLEIWKRIHKWRIDLGYKNVDELIKSILKIVSAKQLEESKQITFNKIKGGDKK